MELGYTTMATPGFEGVEAIRTAKRHGFQGVDMRVLDKIDELARDSTPALIRDIRNAF